ncbi:glycosyltransferase family 4 protein [Dimargaris cristalligena]|uniref:GDP-Man:Man(3)GlcNAc(2)-PP-Dol alpha-1,2-mannosyltransferase n=1 Tax=Dimargaris cristalligena TaxID=215637 RepID=A0A4P9ZR57_9FUNG|nr:glycosyltransferase family 4 protein [Dimargaris cristalligena]|eukprot:RKP35638.1 glycosyltransferase family 4 protein [Dimargaris cristalligena]
MFVDGQTLLIALLYVCLSAIPLGYLAFSYARFQLRDCTADYHDRLTAETASTDTSPDPEETQPPTLVGFFHPYCNAGGGGERVLWTALEAMQNRYPHFRFVVYTGDTQCTKHGILERVAAHFDISLDESRIEFIFLNRRYLVADDYYRRCTLVAQSAGSVGLGWEALQQVVPDVFIDTMGYAFTYPLVKWLTGVPVIAYVHYPTISTDMMQRLPVQAGTGPGGVLATFHSLRTRGLAHAKLIYYRLFAHLYGWAGSYADVVMVNSTWTHNHIASIWPAAPSPHTVCPPCDIQAFQDFSLTGRQRVIISVAQFRPEKNHVLQITAFALYRRTYPDAAEDTRLILLGSSRNQGDEDRINALRRLANELGIADSVHFVINASFPELKDHLARASIGIHTMREEHFGIGIVEYMAAGLLSIAHCSGGPKLDIIQPYPVVSTKPAHLLFTSGFLATTEQEYAECLHYCLDVLTDEQRLSIRQEARRSAHDRFSQTKFCDSWRRLLNPTLSDLTPYMERS